MSALTTSPRVPSTADYRQPPHNLECEQALLGALLVNNVTYQRVADIVQAEHFYEPVHQRLYAAIATLCDEGKLANPVTLKPLFEQDGALADIGGARYLAQLAASVVTIINAADYARQIVDLWRRRELIEIGSDIVNEAYEQDLEFASADQIGAAHKKLDLLEAKRSGASVIKPVSATIDGIMQTVERSYKSQGRVMGLSTGISALDRRLGGLNPSDLLILAGRPSMGKTTLATDIAYRVANGFAERQDDAGNWIHEAGGVVAFFSLEMTAEQLGLRIATTLSGVSGERVRQGQVTKEEVEKLYDALTRLNGLQLYIDDEPGASLASIRASARTIKRIHGLHLIIVDYLQLMAGAKSRGSEQNRTQEVTEITKGLKGLAKELNVPVIALSQLSRAVESREDKRPQLADLRESGSIEQDADVVMFVYREEYYLGRAQPAARPGESDIKFNEREAQWLDQMNKAKGKAEVIVGKQRHGPIGICTLAFDASGPTFRDFHPGESS